MQLCCLGWVVKRQVTPVADVLLGDVNPSGKLPTTFPVRYEDVPSAEHFPGIELDGEGQVFAGGLMVAKPAKSYAEGIYVGYRYYDAFGVAPLYPFGFGLSYTTFEYSDLVLSDEHFNRVVRVSVTVTNTGNVAGKESVQLYLSAPSHKQYKPVRELKGFAKTGTLQPGSAETLTILLDAKALASFMMIKRPGSPTLGPIRFIWLHLHAIFD